MQLRSHAPDPQAENHQLVVLALGLGVLACLLLWTGRGLGLPLVFLAAAVVALAGRLAYRWIGRDVFLLFALVTLGIGRVVSWAAIALTYLIGICLVGSFLRLLGMDRLQRSFAACKERETMFVPAPPTTVESFRRQS